jgi:dipeptidyl aminopeptidase/acylaminoacyl peptidase
LPNYQLAGDHLVFNGTGGGRGGGAPSAGTDEWDRYFSLSLASPKSKPVLLTTTDGMIETPSDVTISADGKTLFYCTNAKDIERRHIWAVPVAGGDPKQVTTGTGIETYPASLASGKMIATISATWNMPNSVGVWETAASQKIVYPTSRPGFPTAAHVEPQLVITQPADKAFEIHNQLFLPKDIKPGEKRPAMIFVHGGPVRQMLLGYHYRYVYHQFYAANEWLASKGYIVMSINYRSGVGYGRSFRNAPNTEARGNSEYQDVVAGAEYLRNRPDVDPKRVGIYGLSYGGLLTAQALARNSDIFALGIDYAGVHLYGSSLDPTTVAYQSSAISNIDKWKSPVLIIQGDDDRNVYFSQTVGLVSLLRARNVDYELLVLPDDVHDSLIWSRWIELLTRSEQFLKKHFGT